MRKKALNKDITKSISRSKGRFISIMLLIALGSFALTGLMVTGSDMRKTGITYFKDYNVADITVTSDYGLDDAEINALKQVDSIKDIEYIYLKDVTVKGKNTSFRIFSNTKNVSKYELVEGSLPKRDNEIALDSTNLGNYKIGDKITFVEDESLNGEDTLKNHTFKITGFINSTEILSNLSRGQTTVGTGSLDCYGVVTEEAFNSDVYMMAKIIFKDTLNLDPYSDEYNDKIISHKKELEDVLSDNKKVRLKLIKTEYQNKIDEASDALNEAKQKLTDAKRALDKANAEINSAQEEIKINEDKLKSAALELSEAKKELNASKEEVNSKKKDLMSSNQKLENAKKEINGAEKTLLEAKENLDNSQNLINEKEQELNTKKEELEISFKTILESKNKLEESRQNLENTKSEYERDINSLNENINSINELLQDENLSLEEKDNYTKELEELKLKLSDSERDYNSFLENVYNLKMPSIENDLKQIAVKEDELKENEELLKDAFKEIQNSKDTLAIKKSEYEKSYQKFEVAKNEYNKNVFIYNDALKQIQTADGTLQAFEKELGLKENEYNSKVKELNDAKVKLEEAKTEYYRGLNDYNNSLPEANDKIAEGEEEIKNAQDELDGLEAPIYEVYNRREVPGGDGFSIYETVSNIIDALANVFPLFMYFVAALVTLTTMTRFVDEERVNMGTLKALGYQDKDIIKKFTVYGFLSASLGTIIGVASGLILLPYIVYNAYGNSFSIPIIEIHFYLKETVLAFALSMLCSVLPAYIVAKRSLREKPANLLLPASPSNGSKILLEKIKPIWKRLNFTKKVTARNIFRYKKRMFMTIFGVAGASAILFTGFAVQRSISTINDKQFGDIIKYDTIVALNDDVKDDELKEFNELLNSDDIKDKAAVYYETVYEEAGLKHDKQEIRLIASKSEKVFKDYIHLHTRKDKKEISLDDDGAVISERLATSMNLKVGDSFTFEDSKGYKRRVKVSDICEMYAGHFIFMNSAVYEKTYNDDFDTNAYMLLLKNSKDIERVSADFIKLSATKGSVQNTSMYNLINTIVKSLNKIMVVLIVLASMLAVVILFNLTNINVAERIRELSTIKVLGFRDNEVTMYIYRETIILSQIGIMIGWIFGVLLHAYILNVVPPDEVMFDPNVWIGAFIISFVVINIVTLALKFYINKKLINVDMIEALKFVD